MIKLLLKIARLFSLTTPTPPEPAPGPLLSPTPHTSSEFSQRTSKAHMKNHIYLSTPRENDNPYYRMYKDSMEPTPKGTEGKESAAGHLEKICREACGAIEHLMPPAAADRLARELARKIIYEYPVVEGIAPDSPDESKTLYAIQWDPDAVEHVYLPKNRREPDGSMDTVLMKSRQCGATLAAYRGKVDWLIGDDPLSPEAAERLRALSRGQDPDLCDLLDPEAVAEHFPELFVPLAEPEKVDGYGEYEPVFQEYEHFVHEHPHELQKMAIAVVTTDKAKFRDYVISQHCEFKRHYMVVSERSCIGTSFDGAVILDHYTEEIRRALLPSLCRTDGAIIDKREDK